MEKSKSIEKSLTNVTLKSARNRSQNQTINHSKTQAKETPKNVTMSKELIRAMKGNATVVKRANNS